MSLELSETILNLSGVFCKFCCKQPWDAWNSSTNEYQEYQPVNLVAALLQLLFHQFCRTCSMSTSMSPSTLNNSESVSENSENEKEASITPRKQNKKEKRGIIYLSTIPKFMNVTKVREIFGEYGEIDRVFLQPEEQSKP